jgi:NTE family protein
MSFATILASGQPMIFNKGDLALAVRASCSVPFVFEPARYRGHFLVDGGLSNPLPGKILRKSGANLVIGVNLYHHEEFVARRFNMANVVMRSTRIALHNLAERDASDCDIVVRPNVAKFITSLGIKKYFSPKNAAEMAETGKRAMDSKIVMIKKYLLE